MNYIAVDLGGTNLRVSKHDQNLEIIDLTRTTTNAEKGVEYIVGVMVEKINEFKDASTLGVVIGVPGQIDYEKGIIKATNNLPFTNYPLAEEIAAKTGLQVKLQNDANLAGLGEAIYGNGKEYDNIYYITWSTGIGGALVIDNKLVNGPNVCTGEIGNLIIWPHDSKEHGFFNKGSLEANASGTKLKNSANENNFESVKALIDAFRQADPLAVEIIQDVTDTLARGLANILHVVEVDAFVFGGGVSIKSGDVLLPLVEEKLNTYLLPAMQGSVTFKMAKLGDDAGLYGAASLVRQIFDNN